MEKALSFALSLGMLSLIPRSLGADLPAELHLPPIFGDHMVLQQGEEVPVWGRAEPRAKVLVAVKEKTVEATADAEGRWTVRLPAMPVSKSPVLMTVQSGGKTITFNDVLVGDVWLCSGQSNMGMGVGAMKRGKEIIAAADHPQIRLFLVDRKIAFEPVEEAGGKWVVCSPESILAVGGRAGFSAVGYFFGLALQQSQDMPIGLIGSHVGGSNIVAWTSRETLAASPSDSFARKRLQESDRDLKNLTELVRKYNEELKPAWDKSLAERNARHDAAMEEWKQAVASAQAAGQTPPPRPAVPEAPADRPNDPLTDFHQASSLYNGMLRPLAPFAIRGVIWYQGEANAYAGMDKEYEGNLGMMIKDWRSLWKKGDLPFLIVQLPNFIAEKNTWPTLRESQRRAVLNTPNTGLAVTYDVGDANNLHPAEKQAVGERLALLARNLVYHEEIVPCGPLITSARAADANVNLSFRYADSGLMAGAISQPAFRARETQDDLRGFEVAGEDGKYLPAKASIVGNEVTVLIPAGSPPVKFVRYAWSQNPDANLYNKDGLPAAPFEIAAKR